MFFLFQITSRMAAETWSSITRAVNQEFTHTFTINKFVDNWKVEDGKLESAPFYIPGLPGPLTMKLEKKQERHFNSHSGEFDTRTPSHLKIGGSPVATAITSYFSVAIAGNSATPAGTKLAGKLEVREEGQDILEGEFGDGNKCIFQTCSDGKWMFISEQGETYQCNKYSWPPASGFYTLGPAPQVTLVASLTLPGKLSTASGVAAVVDKTDSMFDFRPLLKEPKDSDIVLRCKGKNFRCHKIILRAR